MTGIEVLVAQEVVTESIFNWPMFWIVFGAISGLFILIGIILSLIDYDWSNLGVCIIGFIFGLFFGVVVGSALDIPTAYETHYKVTISDEVSMNDFLEKYEIIDQEGKIYTIRERNQEGLQ